MSSDDGLRPSAARRPDLTLPEDPSEEELARNWSLSQADNAQVVRCRGDDNCRRFALQICALRQYGRFLEDYSYVPVRILNHINRQLQLPPALSLQAPERNATETEHRERIREHLGYQNLRCSGANVARGTSAFAGRSGRAVRRLDRSGAGRLTSLADRRTGSLHPRKTGGLDRGHRPAGNPRAHCGSNSRLLASSSGCSARGCRRGANGELHRQAYALSL
jgi:hypothetical protein